MPNRFCEFVHLQLFIVRYKFVHLQQFNVRYKFVHLQLFDAKFLFSKSHIFCKQKGTGASLVSDFNLTRKMMNCYLRDTNKFLRCRTLCTSIRKCRFSTKGIKQTRFLLFEVLEIPQLWGTFEVRKFAEYKWSYGIRNFSVVEKVLRLRICS